MNHAFRTEAKKHSQLQSNAVNKVEQIQIHPKPINLQVKPDITINSLHNNKASSDRWLTMIHTTQ